MNSLILGPSQTRPTGPFTIAGEVVNRDRGPTRPVSRATLVSLYGETKQGDRAFRRERTRPTRTVRHECRHERKRSGCRPAFPRGDTRAGNPHRRGTPDARPNRP